MAVLGVQLVVTLLTATLMHRVAPHCCFCNGSLFQYKHPSEEELRALAGKPRPRGRKERWADGLSEEKPLSVPRDALFWLETCPVMTVDALAYYYVLGPAKETNITVFCACSIKALLMVTRLYFSSEERGERSVCLTFAFLFLLLPMLVQVVREETLELGLEPGLASMTQNLEPLLKKQGRDWALPVAKLAIHVGLAVVGSVLGAFLTFPGLRLAQTHRDALTMSEDQPMLQFLLHTSFLSPLFILWLWTKPIAQDFLHQPPFGEMPFSLLSDSAFDSGRFWLLVVLCLLWLVVTRSHLQAYLCLAKAHVEQLQREAGHIEAREIQRRVVWVYCTRISSPSTARSCSIHWEAIPRAWAQPLYQSPDPSSASAAPVSPEENEVQQSAARIPAALGGLLTPFFLCAACQLLSSLFSLYFQQHLAGS
uniref:Transmembrane protein 161A n=1 Tax=Cebus imitator TaxID=2715852 RepID=A0A2K5QR10_CEBIM